MISKFSASARYILLERLRALQMGSETTQVYLTVTIIVLMIICGVACQVMVQRSFLVCRDHQVLSLR